MDQPPDYTEANLLRDRLESETGGLVIIFPDKSVRSWKRIREIFLEKDYEPDKFCGDFINPNPTPYHRSTWFVKAVLCEARAAFGKEVIIGKAAFGGRFYQLNVEEELGKLDGIMLPSGEIQEA